MAHSFYSRARAVTPNDSTDLPGGRSDALLATTAAGTVVVEMLENAPGSEGGVTRTTVTLYLALGIPLQVKVARVKTGGTATGIIALYG